MMQNDIVLLYGPPWDQPGQLSKHHLARHWANNRRVLYVESPVNPLSILTRRSEAFRLLRRYLKRPVQVADRLWVHTFLYPLPYRGSQFGLGGRWVNNINQYFVLPQLRKVLDNLGFDDPILFVSNAHALPLVDRLPHRLLVYHCSDDYTVIPSFPDSFPELERDFMRRCDSVICTAEQLRLAKRPYNSKIWTVANGAEVDHFYRTQLPELKVADDIAQLPKPVVGYIGSVFRWIDQDMVCHAAERLPEWSFVFIGPIHTDVSDLKALPNIHLLGPRPYAELPGYLKGFDVATVPFTIDEVTLKASPIKFYEYLASGVAIVSARLPDIEPMGDLVHLVEDPDEFVTALKCAIEEDTQEARQRRMRVALNHSWSAQCAKVDQIMRNSMELKKENIQYGPCAG